MSEQQPAPNGSTAQLLQLCTGLDEYTPGVPDQLVQHVLRTTGCNCTDPAILRCAGPFSYHSCSAHGSPQAAGSGWATLFGASVRRCLAATQAAKGVALSML